MNIASTAPQCGNDSKPRPLVSVVIATFNMGLYIEQAIRSILEQDYKSIEIVVVDDGSTDNTSIVLEQFVSDERVRVIRQPNKGQSSAKNAGWTAAKGELIAFCDADDYWLPGKLSRQVPLFTGKPNLGVVYSKTTVLNESGDLSPSPETVQPRGRILERLFVRNCVPFGTAVVRKMCLRDSGGFDESLKMGVDWDLWLRLAVRWEFDCIPDSTYVYRVWAGQMSNNWHGRYQCALDIMEKFVQLHPGLLPNDVVNLALADTYTNYGLASICQDRRGLKKGLGLVIKAVAIRPTFWPAWRVLMTHQFHRHWAMKSAPP